MTYFRHLSDWTPVRIELLRELWPHGSSCGILADKINAATGSEFTRNAVIGKVNREGLPARKRVPTNKEPRKRIRRDRAPRLVPQARPEAPDIIDAQIPLEQRCSLMDLTNATCRWPVGEPNTAEFFFCGDPTANIVEGRPYCAGHMARTRRHSQELTKWVHRRWKAA